MGKCASTRLHVGYYLTGTAEALNCREADSWKPDYLFGRRSAEYITKEKGRRREYGKYARQWIFPNLTVFGRYFGKVVYSAQLVISLSRVQSNTFEVLSNYWVHVAFSAQHTLR